MLKDNMACSAKSGISVSGYQVKCRAPALVVPLLFPSFNRPIPNQMRDLWTKILTYVLITTYFSSAGEQVLTEHQNGVFLLEIRIAAIVFSRSMACNIQSPQLAMEEGALGEAWRQCIFLSCT